MWRRLIGYFKVFDKSLVKSNGKPVRDPEDRGGLRNVKMTFQFHFVMALIVSKELNKDENVRKSLKWASHNNILM